MFLILIVELVDVLDSLASPETDGWLALIYRCALYGLMPSGLLNLKFRGYFKTANRGPVLHDHQRISPDVPTDIWVLALALLDFVS